MIEPTKTRMTAAEFLALPESNTPMELINGDIIMSPSPVPLHQKIVVRLLHILGDIIPDGELITAPMDVHLADGHVLQPDIFWIAADGQCIEKPRHYQGAPDLVVEIHSPATVLLDKREKYDIYEKSGVREYWMIDPSGKLIEVYSLINRQFNRQGVYGAGQQFTSPILDQTIDFTGIFAS